MTRGEGLKRAFFLFCQKMASLGGLKFRNAALFGTFRVSKLQHCGEAALGQESNMFQNIPAGTAVTRDHH